jgi:hypothetical protein
MERKERDIWRAKEGKRSKRMRKRKSKGRDSETV